MTTIGRKIYFEKTNGVVIWDKGECMGHVSETTFEQDQEAVPLLKLIQPEQLGVVQYEYGYRHEEFMTCKAYKIDIETQEPIFIF